MSPKTIFLTGAAGFIGSHTADALLARGHRVIGIDNFNAYYPSERKRRNVEEVRAAAPQPENFVLAEGDIRDRDAVRALFEEHRPDAVVHLAAMAGVRASIDDPALYYDVNVGGTLVLLDEARRGALENFVFASTSSVYGQTEHIPFDESDSCDRPVSPYAASKRAAELLSHTFHHVYSLPITVLRFFTVYGPRGRPDMMAFKVLESIRTGREIPLYNNGDMHRDWTYISDTVAGVVAAAEKPLGGYKILNLGRGQPVLLRDFVERLQAVVGKSAHLVARPMPETDVPLTFADIARAQRLLDYDPRVSVQQGIELFWDWYRESVLGGVENPA